MSDSILEPKIVVLEEWSEDACPVGARPVEAIPVDACADDDCADGDPDATAARRWRHRRHREMLWISCAVVFLSFLLEVRPGGMVAFDGMDSYSLPQTCMSRSLFGVRCPGCGLTRSFVYLAHGQWRESLAIHRLGWLLAVSVLLQFPYRILGLRHPDGLPLGRWIPIWFGRMLIFLLIANWLVEVVWRTQPGNVA